MKFFILLCFSTYILFSATIDTKLYDNEERALYYEEIEKQINKASVEKTKDTLTIKDELFHLSRAREASEQKVQIETYNIEGFEKNTIDIHLYYNLIHYYAKLGDKKIKNSQVLDEIQLKIVFLKNSIENIIEQETSRLLSYQLQFAYYKLQHKNIKIKAHRLDEESIKTKELLLKSFAKIQCDDSVKRNEKLLSIENAISDKKQEIIAQGLEKEKSIIEENQLLETINKKIIVLNENYQDLLEKRISLDLIKAICLLKEKETNNYYKNMSRVKDQINGLSDGTLKSFYTQEILIIREISKIELGRTELLLGTTVQDTKEIFVELREFLFSTLFIFNERSISIFSLFKALFFIILGFTLGIIYKNWISRITSRWTDISMMSIRLISNIGYYLIVLIFFFIAISSLGIDMTSLSLIAGALSIGIGFGLQTVVSNLIAGIILMFERTIRIGDIIEINDVLSGTVTDMRIRSTTIKTFDNIDIVVPNSSFIQNNVINMTLEDRIRRLHIPFGVAYGTEIANVKVAILEALAASDLFYIRGDEDKKPDVRMVLMNSSSVDLELIVWVNRDIKLKNISIQSDFLILIYDALRANNINIPFPQLDVYVKQMIEETKN